MFTIISPDRNPVRLQVAAQAWGRGLSDLGTTDWPFIPVLNAPNIAQAYNDAILKVTTEFCIFSHADAYPLVFPRYFCGKRLMERIAACDVMGFAGSDKFCGASWQNTPTPYGQVINHPPLPEKMDEGTLLGFTTGMRPCSVACWARPARLVRGVRTADGYCIVARTEAMKKLGGFWVPPSCPHFHYYDLDLFLRAFKSGLRTAIATDVYISHSSHGSYQQPEWAGGFEEFMDRWAGEADPSWGIQAVHATLQGDSRICYAALTQQEKFMADEITVRVSNEVVCAPSASGLADALQFPPSPRVVL